MDDFISNLKRELSELQTKFHGFQDEDLFLLWFLLDYITEDLKRAAHAIVNGPNDKGVDAVLFEDESRNIHLIQSKYHGALSKNNESRNDVMMFADLGAQLADPNSEQAFDDLCENADLLVKERLQSARKKILNQSYRLNLYYVTSGKCSQNLRSEAMKRVHAKVNNHSFEIIDGARLNLIMSDYLDGIAPPIPRLELEMEKGGGIQLNGILQRFDNKNKIESWVFSMKGNAVAELYNVAKKRIFARNIRGFLGENKDVNLSMKRTLRNAPDQFFYFNNGITILCDDAKRISENGRDLLQVDNPQIINGQQTTRVLAQNIEEARNASVVVRVVRVAGRDGDGRGDGIAAKIVEGTNWQNTIQPSDLRSNDRVQIVLERELRKLGYLYLRKKEGKTEAKRAFGGKSHRLVKKEELALAVAACEFDPIVARSGKEKLFGDDKYSVIFREDQTPFYYLSRYWLMQVVTQCSRNYPERGYAKWLVMRYAWDRLYPTVKTKNKERAFVKIFERRDKTANEHLSKFVNHVYDWGISYWKSERGTGRETIDASTFFKKSGHYEEFSKYCNVKIHQKHLGAAKKSLDCFTSLLE